MAEDAGDENNHEDDMRNLHIDGKNKMAFAKSHLDSMDVHSFTNH